MKQKMPARGETGYAVFLTVSGRGIQFPALNRSTCRALTEGKADAALAASLFHYKELEIRDLKEYLASRSVSVRL